MEEIEKTVRPRRRVPWWIWTVIIICSLPGFVFPFMGAAVTSAPGISAKGLVWFYIVYTLMSALLAWQCYGRRNILTWIILVLLILSHVSFYYLAFSIAGSPVYFR